MRLKQIALTILLGLIVVPAYAGGFGIQAGVNTFKDSDAASDFGIGARIEVGGDIFFIGSFDYYFVKKDGGILAGLGDTKFYELNGNIAYAFPTIAIRPYIGGGVGIARASFTSDIDEFFDDSQSEVGINLLGGVKFDAGVVSPFVEFRYVIYSGDETFNDRYVLTGGIVF